MQCINRHTHAQSLMTRQIHFVHTCSSWSPIKSCAPFTIVLRMYPVGSDATALAWSSTSPTVAAASFAWSQPSCSCFWVSATPQGLHVIHLQCTPIRFAAAAHRAVLHSKHQRVCTEHACDMWYLNRMSHVQTQGASNAGNACLYFFY